MKKILIVDKNPENLNVAKAYFSNNTNVRLVLKTNLLEALNCIQKVDAIITGMDIPLDKDSKYKYSPSHGYYISLTAKVKNKTVVMLTGDKILHVGSINTEVEEFKTLEKISKNLDELGIQSKKSKKLFSEILKNTHNNNQKIFVFETLNSLNKKRTDAWAIAWDRLNKQF